MFENLSPPRDLLSLNHEVAQSLQTLHTRGGAYRQGHLMARCVRPLDEYIVHRNDDVTAQYCRARLCLLCRRQKATEERGVLHRLLALAQARPIPPLLFFQTLTLQDALPAEVPARAKLLVQSFAKLRRKLPHHLGWARVIETKSADFDPTLENVHLHFVMLFPPGLKDEVGALDWGELWQSCAGAFARDCDPDARIAEDAAAVINYLTKGQVWDFFEDGMIGINDPHRYIQRVENGHAKFSGGSQLRFQPFSSEDRLCGLDVALSRSTLRTQRRQHNPPTYEEIPIEDAREDAIDPCKRRS